MTRKCLTSECEDCTPMGRQSGEIYCRYMDYAETSDDVDRVRDSGEECYFGFSEPKESSKKENFPPSCLPWGCRGRVIHRENSE